LKLTNTIIINEKADLLPRPEGRGFQVVKDIGLINLYPTLEKARPSSISPNPHRTSIDVGWFMKASSNVYEYRGEDLGKKVRSRNIVVLGFWASWCPHAAVLSFISIYKDC